MDCSTPAVATPGLVVVWTRDEPLLLGAVLLAAQDSGTWTFGRGEPRGNNRRLALVREAPGVATFAGLVRCPRVSRAQLRIVASAGGGLLIENIGSCPMVHAGRETTRAMVVPGDTVALRNELLFLCVLRSPMPAPSLGPLALLPHAFGEPDAFGLVGESPEIWALRQRIAAVARQPHHVLILGESGSGKELVARAIHARSSRSARPIVSRNAATIPESLADAELFGNVRNYPNPGMPERPGLVGEAHESTLFLDEFAELPRSIQAHLLRVMDEGEYQRLGESRPRRSDLRILAATNRPETDLKHDVLARLKLRITVPDLNSRREDIPFLAAHLLRQHAARDPWIAERFFRDGIPKGVPLISPVLMEALIRREYTTHVRELDALLLRACLEAQGRYLDLAPPSARDPRSTRPPPSRGEELDGFTSEERARLVLLRHHRFSPSACGRDPAYPGNRQNADLHLRLLFCKALQVANWDTDCAVARLAGMGDAELIEKTGARLTTFLSKLRERLASETTEGLQRAIAKEWKSSSQGVLQIIEALAVNRITGTFAARPCSCEL